MNTDRNIRDKPPPNTQTKNIMPVEPPAGSQKAALACVFVFPGGAPLPLVDDDKEDETTTSGAGEEEKAGDDDAVEENVDDTKTEAAPAVDENVDETPAAAADAVDEAVTDGVAWAAVGAVGDWDAEDDRLALLVGGCGPAVFVDAMSAAADDERLAEAEAEAEADWLALALRLNEAD